MDCSSLSVLLQYSLTVRTNPDMPMTVMLEPFFISTPFSEIAFHLCPSMLTHPDLCRSHCNIWACRSPYWIFSNICIDWNSSLLGYFNRFGTVWCTTDRFICSWYCISPSRFLLCQSPEYTHWPCLIPSPLSSLTVRTNPDMPMTVMLEPSMKISMNSF